MEFLGVIDGVYTGLVVMPFLVLNDMFSFPPTTFFILKTDSFSGCHLTAWSMCRKFKSWPGWPGGHLCEAQFIYLQNGGDDSYLSGSLSLGAFTEKRPWSHVLRSTRKAFCTHGYTPEKENKQMLGLPSCLYLLEKRDSAGSDGNSMWSGVIVYGRWPRPNLLNWARINRHAEARMNSGHIPGVFRILRCSNDQKGFLFI